MDIVIYRGYESRDILVVSYCTEYLWINPYCDPYAVSEEMRRRAGRPSHRQLKERYDKEPEIENHKQDFTYVALFLDYTKQKNVSKGVKLHSVVLKTGLLEKSPYLASTIVSFYVKCGMLEKAKAVLEDLPVRTVVTWNSLIAGYTKQGQSSEALNFFEQMQNEGLSPDIVTFTCILKACAKTRDVKKGKQIHECIVRRGLLEKDVILGTALVDMYVKCRALEKAKQVLKELPVRDIVTWNALIAGYVQERKGYEALSCFEWMRSEGFFPDMVTYLSILKACGITKDLEKGGHFHEEILSEGLLETDVVVGNALVDMYAKCGMLAKSHQVLEEIPVRNTVSWNALIAGYAQEGQDQEALDCFEQMQNEGLSPDSVTFICTLNACAKTRALNLGKKIHEVITSRGLLGQSTAIGNALVDMYAKCGELGKAQEVLQKLPDRDVVTWSAIIAGYADQGQSDEALECFAQMQKEGLSPNVVTLVHILKACGNAKAIEKGKQVHDEILSKSLLEKDPMLGSALVDMYANCGAFAKAEQVLEDLHVKSIVSWSALIAGYCHQGQGHEALECFERMQNEGLSPDEVTFVCILKACGSTGSLRKGKQVHDAIVKEGFLAKNIILGNALVDMYCKCGAMVRAADVLRGFPFRDIISWNTLITGYLQQGQYHDALNCFEQMQCEGQPPDAVTFACVLQACGNSGAIDKGKQIHEEIVNSCLLEKEAMLGNALVDMYAKCGMLEKASQVLQGLHVQDVVSWNALIAGYAEQRQGQEALNCFRQMQREGISPNQVTFLCVLDACSHSGLLDDLQTLFNDMAGKYGISPEAEHHTCMVMAFGDAGLFDKALSVINVMPSCDDYALWLALLTACRKWGNVELGKLAFNQAIQIETGCAAAYVVMAYIFTAAGLREDAEHVETMRRKYADRDKQEILVLNHVATTMASEF